MNQNKPSLTHRVMRVIYSLLCPRIRDINKQYGLKKSSVSCKKYISIFGDLSPTFFRMI